VGTTPVEVIATDASGNADTCYFNVTVNESEPPAVQCPDDITRDNDPGECGAVVDFTIDATDNCPGVSVSSNPTSGSIFPVGITPVEVIATDASGNADTCHFNATVNDTEPPVAECPDDITQGVDTGECTAVVSFSIDAADNCLGVSVSSSPTSGSTFPVGTTPVEVIATDAAGNADTCYFDVTVNNEPPVLTCPNNGSVHAGEDFVSSDFSVSDPEGHSTSITFLSIDPAATNVPTLVDNHVEWTTTCDEDGDHTICLETTDECGAKDTCCFVVTVGNQPPELTCPDNDSAKVDTLFVSTDYYVYDPDDASGVTVTLHSITPAPVDSPILVDDHLQWLPCATDYQNGPDFTMALLATDPCGAADTCSFVVTVYNLPPILTLPPDDSVPAGDYFVSGDFSASDAKGPVTVSICGVSPPSVHAPIIVESHVEMQTECDEASMVYTICLEATDDCGAKDTGYFDVTVYNRDPVFTCPENGNVYAEDNFVSTDFSATDPDGDPVTVGLCGVTPAPVNQPVIVGSHVEWQSDCDDAGNVFTFCLEAVDSCGAVDTCRFDVTVFNEPPVATCPDDDSVHAEDRFISIPFSATDEDPDCLIWDIQDTDGATEPTNAPYIEGDHVEWLTTCAEDGDYVITLTVTDHCGLEDTCVFTVTVYNRPPVLQCPPTAEVVAGDLLVSGDFYVSDPDGDAVDVIIEISPPATYDPIIVGNHVEWQTTTAEDGSYIITLTAVDECGAGGKATTCCSFIVTTGEPPEGHDLCGRRAGRGHAGF
jgi:hypothetical protein